MNGSSRDRLAPPERRCLAHSGHQAERPPGWKADVASAEGSAWPMRMHIRSFRSGDAAELARIFHAAVHQVAALHCSLEQLNAWAPVVPDSDRFPERELTGGNRGMHFRCPGGEEQPRENILSPISPAPPAPAGAARLRLARNASKTYLTSMSATTKLSAKGQVVIPADVRRELGLKPGQTLQVRKAGGGVMLTPVLEKSGRSTDELLAEIRKIYTHKGPPATIEDMDRAVERMFAERGRDDF